MPLGAFKAGAATPEDLVEEARVTINVCIRAVAIAGAIGAAGGIGDAACVDGADSVALAGGCVREAGSAN